MAHRNRVDPFGQLQAVSDRGLLFGNRGVLHNRHGTVVRTRTSERRWISCRLEFKGRHRELLRPGRYTELFFLDEATALAAGHRPCLECRRPDGLAFLAGLAAVRPELGPLRVGELDALVDPHRLTGSPLGGDPLALPDGAMVGEAETAYLVHAGRLWRWTPGGYQPTATARPDRLLTPPPFVDALAGGYRPLLHPRPADRPGPTDHRAGHLPTRAN